MPTSEEKNLHPGADVRLRHNPTSRGVLQRSRERVTGLHWYVALAGQKARWVPESQLELAPSTPDTPLDLLETGEYGVPADLRRILTHIRVSGHPADMLYSMEATNTQFKAFQFKPVIKILESPSGRVLLADEVGLGKTIEAGLIWTELRSRFDYRRLLVLCPKSLTEKWQRELRLKFGVRGDICKAGEVLQRLQNTPKHDPLCLIASTSSLRPPRQWNELSNAAPAAELARFLENAQHDPCFDLLVVDEAHHGRNPKTHTHRLIALATEAARQTVFLSATPVHNRQMDLFALLKLLDPDTFTDLGVLSEIQNANAPLLHARDRLRDLSTTASNIADQLDRTPLHPLISESEQLRKIQADLRQAADRPLAATERSALAHRLERVNLLGHVINRTRRRDVEENRVVRDLTTESVSMTQRERRYYGFVTDAVRDYAEKSDITDGWLLSQPQRQMASCFAASASRWLDIQRTKERENILDPEWGEETGNDVGPLIAHIRDRLIRRYPSYDVGPDDLPSLLEKEDTKYKRLEKILRGYFEDHPHEKVVLFSTFRETVKYLSRRLQRAGLSNLTLMGGQPEGVDAALARFAASDGPQILLSTEVASEGVDLQFSRLLVNYDLPWNPMRIEQRIGRLDRIGQTAEKITIWTLLHEDTIDLRIQQRLYEKLNLFRTSLGECEDVVAKAVSQLSRELLSGRLDADEQERKIEQTALAIQNVRAQEAHLEEEAPGLTAYGDYILHRVETARTMHRWLDAQDLDTYVVDNLKRLYPGTRVHRPSDAKRRATGEGTESDAVELDLSAEARRDLEAFIQRSRLSADTLLTRAFGRTRCHFSSRPVVSAKKAEEVITQFHPITRFIAEELNDPEGVHPRSAVVAARLDRRMLEDALDGVPAGIYVLTIAAIHFAGLRQTTHIKYAAQAIRPVREPLPPDDAERLALATIAEGETWLAARGAEHDGLAGKIAEELFSRLGKDFEAARAREQAENDDRARWQLAAISRQLDRATKAHREKATSLRERAALFRERGDGRQANRFENLANGAETQLRTLTERLEGRRKSLGAKRKVQAGSPEELAIALVWVSGSEAEVA